MESRSGEAEHRHGRNNKKQDDHGSPHHPVEDTESKGVGNHQSRPAHG
jgi:hypothetical protein